MQMSLRLEISDFSNAISFFLSTYTHSIAIMQPLEYHIFISFDPFSGLLRAWLFQEVSRPFVPGMEQQKSETGLLLVQISRLW